MKTCTKCGESKTEDGFYKDLRKKDGLMSCCKGCQKNASAAWVAANHEHKRAYSAKWQTENKEKRSAYNAQWLAANTEKRLKSITIWKSKNGDKIKAYDAKWRLGNPEALRINTHNRRARKRNAGGKLSKGLTEKLFTLQRGKCACGCKQPLGDDCHLDHVMPLALGGANTDDNMQLLRATCNHQKSAKHPVDFMQQRGFLL